MGNRPRSSDDERLNRSQSRLDGHGHLRDERDESRRRSGCTQPRGDSVVVEFREDSARALGGACKSSQLYAAPLSAFAPGAEDGAADRPRDQGSAHVDENEGPRICLEGREHGDGGVLDKKKREPADECDLQTGDCVRRIEARDQPGERIIDDDRREDCEQVCTDIMRPVNVRHRSGVKVEPFFAEDCVPAVADELMNNDEDPDSEMMDLAVHEVADYPAVRNLVASRFSEKVARKNEQYPVFPSRRLAHPHRMLGCGQKDPSPHYETEAVRDHCGDQSADTLLIWLLLIALSRKEAEPPRQPTDYFAPSRSG